MSRIVFLDTETTGLDADRHEIWEVAAIDGGDEWTWQLPVDEGRADPVGLRIGGFYERRHPTAGPHWLPAPFDVNPTNYVLHPAQLGEWCRGFARLTTGAHLCGAVVSFDEERLRKLLRANGACPRWHYHVIDVEALAVGFFAGRWTQAGIDGQQTESGPFDVSLPWNSDELSKAVGVDPSLIERHTALGDARWARAIYRAVVGAED